MLLSVALLLSCLGAPDQPADAAPKNPTGPRALLGEEAPRFILRTLNPEVAGERFILRDHVGPSARTPKKKVLLDFAASWCVPCRDELAEITKRKRAFDAAGVAVAVVVIDKEEEGIATMKKLIQDLNLPFPVVSDRFQVLARRYHVGTLPLAVVVEPTGRVSHVQEGYTAEHLSRLEGALGVSPPRSRSVKSRP